MVERNDFKSIDKLVEVSKLWADTIVRIDIQYNYLTELYSARVWTSVDHAFDIKYTEDGLKIATVKH